MVQRFRWILALLLAGPGCDAPGPPGEGEGEAGPGGGGGAGAGFGGQACTLAAQPAIPVASTDPSGSPPYALGYPPYATDGCRLAYVPPEGGPNAGALVLRDLVSGDESVLAPPTDAPWRPSMAADVVAWEARTDGVKVVRVHARGETRTVAGPFAHAGEPRATIDAVVFTAWVDADPAGDTDVYLYDVDARTTSPVAVGPGQQRFADVSPTHVAFADFSEDPDGRFDDDANDLADVVLHTRDSGVKAVRTLPGKQAFPMLGDGGFLAYLNWGAVHPEPKLTMYDLFVAAIGSAPEDDVNVAQIVTAMPYIRPTLRGATLQWVQWPEDAATLWRRPADLSSPAAAVAGLEGVQLLGPAGSAGLTLIAARSGHTAPLELLILAP